MELSKRIRAVISGADDGWSLYYRARAMKAAGQPVVMLTIGDHDIKTDPSILDAMKASMDAGHLAMPSPAG
jgi:arginine:pyruvate transaminase